jgi:hypothetical protein
MNLTTSFLILAQNEHKIDAIRALQATEKNWNHLMKEIDDCMKALWRATERDYVNVTDIGTVCNLLTTIFLLYYEAFIWLGRVKVIDCESSKVVTLREVLSARYGRYTLFVLIR